MEKETTLDRRFERFLRIELEMTSPEKFFSNEPHQLLRQLRYSAMRLRGARRLSKNTISPKTGKPYARKTIRNYKSDAKTLAEGLAGEKALVKLGTAAGFIGRGPKTDFERLVGVLLRLFIESKLELASIGLSRASKMNRQYRREHPGHGAPFIEEKSFLDYTREWLKLMS